MEWSRSSFRVTCDLHHLNRDFVATFLANTYWAQNIPRDVVEKSLEGSICFSLLEGDRQIGFARVVSDKATFAYLCDVFVIPECRSKGLGTWLVECVMSHPDLQGLRRWLLVTRDAHEIYKKYGFTALARPEGVMEIHNPEIYSSGGRL
jgi:GNAT superfamily N-acetyltransferase